MSYYPEYEAQARKYCELTGLDPDQIIQHDPDPDGSGISLAILCYSPRWQRVTRKLRAHDLLNGALGEAKRSPVSASEPEPDPHPLTKPEPSPDPSPNPPKNGRVGENTKTGD